MDRLVSLLRPRSIWWGDRSLSMQHLPPSGVEKPRFASVYVCLTVAKQQEAYYAATQKDQCARPSDELAGHERRYCIQKATAIPAMLFATRSTSHSAVPSKDAYLHTYVLAQIAPPAFISKVFVGLSNKSPPLPATYDGFSRQCTTGCTHLQDYFHDASEKRQNLR